MKRVQGRNWILIPVFLFAVLLGILPVKAYFEEAGTEVLTVGVPSDRCPVFYEDPDTGEVIGIGADLMRAAAENAGYEVSFIPIAEATLKDALDNDRYDVLMPFGSAVSSTSGKPSAVSENLFQTPFTLVTEENRNLPSLNELHVGMLESQKGVAETVHLLYPGMTISTYATMQDSVKALRKQEVDALLHNSYVWSYVLQKPSYSDLRVQPFTVFSMDFRAGTLDTEEGRKLIDRLNEGISMITDIQRQAIILDYTSRKLYRYDFSDYLYRYWLAALLLALVFALLIAWMMRKIKANQIAQEEQIRQIRDIDPLTGVLTMNAFKKRVEELIRAHPDIPYLLAYTNIRDFKYINDSLGREAGDDLLRFWSSKTMETLSEIEAMCRITADRFAVFRTIKDEEKIRQDESEVIGPLRNYFTDRGMENRVQVCSGVYILTPEDYQKIDVDRMLDCARVAEQRVRSSRKDGYEFYNPEEWKRGRQVADICGHLPIAIRDGELQVWYQPQVNYAERKITGAEALCRWNHAKLGWLSPGDFISILEDAGLIYDLDRHVWETVCRNLQRWNEQGRHRTISVNLSRCDITEERNIPKEFFDLTQKYHLTPDQIRIEITESAYAENPDLLIRTTVELREFGFQVEMDDFGSGYSSLHMLKEVPVDRIKLDLHFLSGEGDPEKGRIIISQIVQLVHSLGMSLIAEGVENASQAGFLESTGCAEMQGFYFFKPMSAEEFEGLDESFPE